MSEVIAETTGAWSDRIAVVSGPNLAAEIVARQPAASVVACTDESTAALIQSACHTPYFRPYTNTDVIGCELGGAIKNVIALAVGVTDGMRLGDNAKAALVTRGWPRRPGWASPWVRTRSHSPGWPAWATWWPRARPRCPVTTPSAPTWAGA
ncbi:hypothetical protein GCM10017687_24650 [Streptomyces echinatus]